MPDRELLGELIEKEIVALEIYLTGGAMRSAVTLQEYINVRMSQGVSKAIIEQELLKDLSEGGRIFGEFRTSMQSTANGSVGRLRDAGMESELGVDLQYRWVAVLVNTCPDCMVLHGAVKSWEEWEDGGLPRVRGTVCRQNCKCMLVPAETTETEVIKRDKRKSRLK